MSANYMTTTMTTSRNLLAAFLIISNEGSLIHGGNINMEETNPMTNVAGFHIQKREREPRPNTLSAAVIYNLLNCWPWS